MLHRLFPGTRIGASIRGIPSRHVASGLKAHAVSGSFSAEHAQTHGRGHSMDRHRRYNRPNMKGVEPSREALQLFKKKKKEETLAGGRNTAGQWQELLIRVLSEAVKNGAVAPGLTIPGEIKKLITCCLMRRSEPPEACSPE